MIDADRFAHRTGRTARMGAAGTSVLLYDPSAGEGWLVPSLARMLGIKMLHADAPSHSQVLAAAMDGVTDRLNAADPYLVAALRDQARALLEKDADVLAKALAAMCGRHGLPTRRSLLDNREGMVTVHAQWAAGAAAGGGGGLSPSALTQAVRARLGGFKLGRVSMCADGTAVFDVPLKAAHQLCAPPAGEDTPHDLRFSQPDALPPLQGRTASAPADREVRGWGFQRGPTHPPKRTGDSNQGTGGRRCGLPSPRIAMGRAIASNALGGVCVASPSPRLLTAQLEASLVRAGHGRERHGSEGHRREGGKATKLDKVMEVNATKLGTRGNATELLPPQDRSLAASVGTGGGGPGGLGADRG